MSTRKVPGGARDRGRKGERPGDCVGKERASTDNWVAHPLNDNRVSLLLSYCCRLSALAHSVQRTYRENAATVTQ